MDQKSNPTSAKAAKAGVKRPKVSSETARLFLDVEELIRRSQTMRLSRYVE